jgi:hypothetical protein
MKAKYQDVPKIELTEEDEAERHNQKLDRQLTQTAEELGKYCSSPWTCDALIQH